MKKYPSQHRFIYLFFSLCVFFAAPAAAQDIILKTDTIRCKIIKETDDEYIYTYRDANGAVVNGKILKSKVSEAQYDVKNKKAKQDENAGGSSAAGDDNSGGNTGPWKGTFAIDLNVGNFYEINADPGPDKTSFSGTGAIDLGLNYKKDGARFEMTNEAHWIINAQKEGMSDTAHIQRVKDDLQTLHDFSMGITKKNRVSINLIAKTTTSIFTIYDGDYFKDVNHAGRVQGFLNPYEAILSPGLKLQPDNYLRISVSPYSMRLYGVENQRIANTGLYTTDPDSNGIYDRFEFKQLGAELNVWYDREIGRWLTIQYRVSVSAEYLENIGKNGLLDGLFITKIRLFKDLFLSHRAELKGDFSVKPFKPYYAQTIMLSYTKNI